MTPIDEDAHSSRHFLAQIAKLISKVAGLQDRHNRLQKLAITDQLTGVYNRRYFEHFLTRILEKARVLRFPVTLLFFDIDNFKRYNDTYGHGVGDQILKETASLMRKTCREHDLVARIGGDEFAVVFWEKEGPRLPKDAKPVMPSKPPQSPRLVFERFRRQMASQDFPGLGSSGKGVLTISGGLASFPWDGRDVAELIEAADQALVKGAKQGGKDRIFLVGEDGEITSQE
jgi:two-component system cell cycle response regulator